MKPSRSIRALSNSLVMLALRLGLPVPPYSRDNALILETVGQRSGKRRRNPVGCIREDGRIIVVAEHGAGAHWVRNALARDGYLRVYHQGRWREARLHLLEGDPEPYLQRMDKRHASLVRRLATTPRAVEITVE